MIGFTGERFRLEKSRAMVTLSSDPKTRTS
jgi:hypothetical protein